MSRRKRAKRINASFSPKETSFIQKMKNQMQGFIERIGENIESSEDISDSKSQSMLRLYSKLSRDYVFLHDRQQKEIKEEEKKEIKIEAEKKKQHDEEVKSLLDEGNEIHKAVKEYIQQRKEGTLNQPRMAEKPEFNGLLMPDP